MKAPSKEELIHQLEELQEEEARQEIEISAMCYSPSVYADEPEQFSGWDPFDIDIPEKDKKTVLKHKTGLDTDE